jgi:DNA (cytosine-5)-methyltransferase 1
VKLRKCTDFITIKVVSSLLRLGVVLRWTLITEGDFVNELALFAGAGGGILGGKLLGWRTVCAVEWEPYPASVLCARQNDKVLETFPIWDDVQTFDGKPWRGIVDVVSGGFPCQDISAAGKGVGIDGERSGMWGEMARIIHEVQPRYAFVENSPMLTSRGLGRVLGDLASMGFDARWGVLGAADVGANHQRDRIWIIAKWKGQLPHTQHNRIRRWEQQQESIKKENESMANPDSFWRWSWNQCEQSKRNTSRESISISGEIINESKYGSNASWWQFEPNVGRVADGVAARVHRIKAIGNGQVPLCAATAWRILSE